MCLPVLAGQGKLLREMLVTGVDLDPPGMDGCKGMEHPRQGLVPCQTGWSSPASAISPLPCEGPLIPLCLQEQAHPGLAWCFQPNQGLSSLSGHFSPCPRVAEQAEPVTPHFFPGVGSFCSVPQQILSGSEHVAVTPLGALGEWEQGLGSPGELQFR